MTQREGQVPWRVIGRMASLGRGNNLEQDLSDTGGAPKAVWAPTATADMHRRQCGWSRTQVHHWLCSARACSMVDHGSASLGISAYQSSVIPLGHTQSIIIADFLKAGNAKCFALCPRVIALLASILAPPPSPFVSMSLFCVTLKCPSF